MRTKDTNRRKSRFKTAAKQRKRRADQARTSAHRKRAKFRKAHRNVDGLSNSGAPSAPKTLQRSGGRKRGFGDFVFEEEFEPVGMDVVAGAENASVPEPANRHERRKRRREQGTGDFLVDKEIEAHEVGIGAPRVGAASSLAASDHLDAETLRNFLILSPVGMAQRFIRDVLKSELVSSGSRFVSLRQDFLQTLYTVAVVIDGAEPIRRSALLQELGCEPDPKNIFLAVCNVAMPVPMIAHLGNATRKMAQNRNSDYGRAMRGAQILGIETYEFAHRLNLAGGIQALAGVAREWDRQRREETAFADLTDVTKDAADDNKTRLGQQSCPSAWEGLRRSTSPRRRVGRVREHASVLLWKRLGPAERMDEWTLKVTERMAERVIDYERPVIAILIPKVDGFSASMHMLAAQEYPFAISEQTDDVLYDIIHEMGLRRR